MSEAASWEAAFVAVSVLLGEPVDEVARALGGGEASADASTLLRTLGGSSRDTRARALARVVSEVAVAIDALRLA